MDPDPNLAIWSLGGSLTPKHGQEQVLDRSDFSATAGSATHRSGLIPLGRIKWEELFRHPFSLFLYRYLDCLPNCQFAVCHSTYSTGF